MDTKETGGKAGDTHTVGSPSSRKRKPSGLTTFPAQLAGQAAKRVSEEGLERVEAGRQVSLRPPDTFPLFLPPRSHLQ